MRKYRKVSEETRFLASSEASQEKTSSKANRMPFNKANCSTSLKVHETSLEANSACDEVSKETRKTCIMDQDQHNDIDQSLCQASLEA